MSNNLLFYLIFFTCGSYYYLSDYRFLTFPVYLICITLFILKIFKFSIINNKIFTLLLIFMVVIVSTFLTFNNLFGQIFSLRLNFGFIILFFGLISISFASIDTISIILSSATLIEYVLLRINPEIINYLPNYFGSTFSVSQAAGILGGVHSFGGNRSVTAVILLSIYLYQVNIKSASWRKRLTLLSSIICESGTAYIIMAVYFLCKINKNLLIPLIIFLCFIIFYKDTNDEYLVGRFNYGYLEYLWHYKYNQLIDLTNQESFLGYLFGLGSDSFSTVSGDISGYGSSYGDFLALDFFARYGILGCLLIFYSILLVKGSPAFLPFMVLIFGTFHYHVIFSMPGQFIAAYYMALSLRSRHEID